MEVGQVARVLSVDLALLHHFVDNWGGVLTSSLGQQLALGLLLNELLNRDVGVDTSDFLVVPEQVSSNLGSYLVLKGLLWL